MQQDNASVPEMTVGLDVSDRFSHLCALDRAGEITEEARLRTTQSALRRRFGGTERTRIVVEVGPQSPWIVRLLRELDHEVLPANPRKLRLIYDNDRKSDRVDAEYLARVGRLDPELLAPIRHRTAETQADLALLRSRDMLVRSRTKLVNHVRGTVKALGARLPRCSSKCFHTKVREEIPDELRAALEPLLDVIAELTTKIRAHDKEIERLCKEKYPETELLRQVRGVGALTALCYILTLEDARRFDRSRSVGPYLGLVPKRDASGDSDPRLPITKAGDERLRRLLVQSAQYILGPFGEDCDLRRWGLGLAERGGAHGKKRAVVAVARKLAVLLHRLWSTGEVYEPLYNEKRKARGNTEVKREEAIAA